MVVFSNSKDCDVQIYMVGSVGSDAVNELGVKKILFFGGMGSVVWGCWMIYRPLGPIIGGVLAVWLGMLISVERNEPRS